MNLKCVVTRFLNNKKNEFVQYMKFIKDNGVEHKVINIYPNMRYQTFEGFGGALTESSGYVYSKMDKKQKHQLISTYFDEDNMNYRLARIHLDSCDFSLGHYEAMSDKEDINMYSFSLKRSEKYIFPLVDDVQKYMGRPIEIMVSPWSPPAFMKTNGERNHGGSLKEEYKEFWARYLCKYIVEFRNRGYNVKRMSIQNEPRAVQIWDSCIYSAKEEKEFLRDYLYPEMIKNNLTDVEIFIWDHNKERIFERACEIIDEDTNHMITGIAFHWYSGDHFEALNLVNEKFPDKKLILSEACIEYSHYSKEDRLFNAQRYAHDIIGNLNNGMSAFYDWNILLDENGGPNHVGNCCDAPFLYDIQEGKLIERKTLSYIKHFSHYIKPGAVRIGYSKYTDALDVTAFENPDKSIVLIILNRFSDDFQTSIRLYEEYTNLFIPSESIITCVINR
ncbi:glycoside hydrolase family 30 protein [Defluviitalea phaphyphila]|uniref:glycoside hydrolase family 30 protein n=1 Tax=Defluviitalea phaphyphila TaxID=1473580 RepID=UPI000731CD14|nr:glycoside hydrolase family 30 beta sandwich domain-containing protein [Defluviitalea phaphyphila]